jgi:alkanesulfonate monooxygenase SsuD/methylene tetrahydromethanopterin reductase-like flavin-dependent oxidoreductase (luciferase family)
MRETIDVIRQAFAGEKINYGGSQVTIPRPGGHGRSMRLSLPANPDIPIYIASMSPKMLELTGGEADGWLGTSFVPEGSDAYFTHLDRGLAAAGRNRKDLDVCQGAEVAILRDEDAVAAHVETRKRELAFSLGGMGSAGVNFYNNAYSRQGWDDVAAEICDRWRAGDRDGASALVTDDMVLGTTLIGTKEMVFDRLRVWRDVGVDTVRLYPAGDTLDQKLETLECAIGLVRALD